MKIYILTCKNMPKLGTDDSLLPDELRKLGFEPNVVVWDESSIPNGSTVLIRTIWDYPQKREAFEKLLADFKTRGVNCINDVATLMWNMDKSYLIELEEKGLPVVKTVVKKQFSFSDLEATDISYPLVLKPLVGASGVDTFLVEKQSELDKASNLLGKQVMIQPYMPSIRSVGEISLIFFLGRYSHSVLKTADQGSEEFRIQEEHGGRVAAYQADESEIQQAQDILAKLEYPWVYARVDMVESDNKLLLMELELIEPELFFRFSSDSMKMFSQGLAKEYHID